MLRKCTNVVNANATLIPRSLCIRYLSLKDLLYKLGLRQAY